MIVILSTNLIVWHQLDCLVGNDPCYGRPNATFLSGWCGPSRGPCPDGLTIDSDTAAALACKTQTLHGSRVMAFGRIGPA